MEKEREIDQIDQSPIHITFCLFKLRNFGDIFSEKEKA